MRNCAARRVRNRRNKARQGGPGSCTCLACGGAKSVPRQSWSGPESLGGQDRSFTLAVLIRTARRFPSANPDVNHAKHIQVFRAGVRDSIPLKMIAGNRVSISRPPSSSRIHPPRLKTRATRPSNVAADKPTCRQQDHRFQYRIIRRFHHRICGIRTWVLRRLIRPWLNDINPTPSKRRRHC